MTPRTLTHDDIAAWFEALRADFSVAADALGELDRRAGDGDFGLNMSVALDRVDSALAALPDAGPAEQLRAIARAFADNGGSSGPLLSAWFRELAREATPSELEHAGLTRGTRAGLERIQALGGAQVGDSTMIDALDPAADALAAAPSLDGAIAAAAAAARAGAAGTAHLTARRGRASYVGELSRGVEDPGAVFVAMMFEALDRISHEATR